MPYLARISRVKERNIFKVIRGVSSIFKGGTEVALRDGEGSYKTTDRHSSSE